MYPLPRAIGVGTASGGDSAASETLGAPKVKISLQRFFSVTCVVICFNFICAGIAAAAPGDCSAGGEASAPARRLGIEEYRKIMCVSVKVLQSRLFQIRNRIVRTSIGDPGIAEPVVVAENQFLLLGRKPGKTTLGLWDDAGGVVCMDVRVERQHGLFKSAVMRLRDDLCRGLLGFEPETKIDSAFPSGAVIVDEYKLPGKVEGYPLRSEPLRHRPTPVKARHIGEKVDLLAVPRVKKVDDSSLPSLVPVTIISGSRKVHESNGSFRRVELFESESRIFRTKSTIAKTVIGDPALSEPVVVSSNEFVLLGRAPGHTVMMLHDDAGNAEALRVRVSKPLRTFKSTLKVFGVFVVNKIRGVRSTESIPPSTVKTIDHLEQKVTRVIELNRSQTKLFKTKNALVRMSIANPGIAEPVVVSANEIALVGRSPGRTTLFLWNDYGNGEGVELRVSNNSETNTKAEQSSVHDDHWLTQETKPDPEVSKFPVHEIECWIGEKKEIVRALSKEDSTTAGCGPILSDMPDDATSGDPPLSQAPANRELSIHLNNDGVKALRDNDYDLAVRMLQAAMKADPSYQRARENLAIAFNNWGLSLCKKPEEAIKHFHKAAYLDSANETTSGNLDGIIRMLGRDSLNFADRVTLGDLAVLANDPIGAVVEYQAALAIMDDQDVRKKLDKAKMSVNEQSAE